MIYPKKAAPGKARTKYKHNKEIVYEEVEMHRLR